MHGARGTHYRVHRTGLNALGAADAVGFIDISDLTHRLGGGFAAQRLRLDVEQFGQFQHHLLAAGGAFVDHLTVGHRLGVRAATGVTALAALALRQDLIDLLGHRIFFHFKAARGEAQHQPEQQAEGAERSNRNP